MHHDLTTPEGRLAAAEALGPDGYNAAMTEHLQRSTVATVAGHAIRTVNTRFGLLFAVGTPVIKAFRTFSEAETFATHYAAAIETLTKGEG